MVDFDTILQSGAMGLAFFALYILYQFINGKRNGNENGNGHMGKKFDALGKKMDSLGVRMDTLGNRFDHSMERFCDRVEGKLDKIIEKEMEK